MTLLCCFFFFFFFFFHNFEYKGSNNVSVKIYNQLYLMVPEKKLILMVLLFLVMAAILDSRPNPNL